MNPSAAGWIEKFGELFAKPDMIPKSSIELYEQLRKTGFVFGINVEIFAPLESQYELSEIEKAKINLLSGLFITYKLQEPNGSFQQFLEFTFSFYQKLEVGTISFIKKILTGSKTSSQLEKLINSRILLDESTLTQTFNSNLTNSLIFVDVLVFEQFLRGKDALEHAQLLEYLTINIALHGLSAKGNNKKDEKLIQALSSSLTYLEENKIDFDQTYIHQLKNEFSTLERMFFMDVACMTVWEDKAVVTKESEFVHFLGKVLGFETEWIQARLRETARFLELHKDFIPHLQENNLASQFYQNMSKVVKRLIIRNSQRLQKEFQESKELVFLLSKSTSKELTLEERKKVQEQLVDIFKSIPSLAIFMLPGGAVLLPIFIRLVPKLLPSSFDDNRLEEDQKTPKKG